MANSKSNIYPIQLQGAELCLNRYDAEIKQYRGFNKNNSPFVGGCLSNVFEKDETIEGATDDNTYIDTNGDKYTVDTEGLYKNGEKLVDYTGCDFIEREKIKIPYKDCIKAYSDKVCLREVNNDLYLNDVYIGMNRFAISKEELLAKYSCGIWYHGKFIFACWCYNIVPDWSPDPSRTIRIVTLEKNSDGDYVLGNVNFTQLKRNAGPGEIDTEEVSPFSIIISNEYFEVIYTKITQETDTFPTQLYLYSGNFNSSTVTETYLHDGDNRLTFASGWDDTYYKSNDFQTLKKVYIEMYSYPRNEVNFFSFNVSATSTKKLALTVKLNAEECQTSLVLHPENVIRFMSSTSLAALGRYHISALKLDSSIINTSVTPLLHADYIEMQALTAANVTFEQGTSPYNFSVTGGVTRTIDNCNYAILINNGVVSGIAAYKNNNKILVTNWNTVDEALITYVQEGESDDLNLLYGDYEGNYYLLKKSETPKLKRVNNQIVTNALSNHNCWFMNKNKLGCFATGFNFSTKSSGYSMQKTADRRYIAAAINEYNLEDNASIILNPFQSRRIPAPEDLTFLYINVYSTTNGAVPTYYRTYYYNGSVSSFKIEYDTSLTYPSDTNGNVSYNPSLYSEIINIFGNKLLIKEGNVMYPLQIYNNESVMSFYLASGIENIENGFIIQGQYYGIIDNCIYTMQTEGGVTGNIQFIVDITGLQFVGNTPYEALFFSKTNRCLYSFTGANVLNQKQLVDKISEVRNYLYNPATQTVFLITDIGVLFYGLFGMFLLEYTNISNIFLLDNGIVMSDNSGNYRYIKYYLDEGDTDYTKENINVETSFYGMNNEVVTINDCLYFRIFSEEHEEGDLKVSATTISLRGRKTEETTFKIKASDWDKITHTIYLRYQPKTQRGLGVAFAIDSPFKIASLSVGSQPDAVLVDKVSKGAITAPSVTTNNNEW